MTSQCVSVQKPPPGLLVSDDATERWAGRDDPGSDFRDSDVSIARASLPPQKPGSARRVEPAVTKPAKGRSPWATTAEGAEYVRCPNPDAFRKWARRAGIVPAYRGRVPLYAWRDIDRALGVRGELAIDRGIA